MNKSLYRFISGAMLAAALTAAEDAPWQERSDGFVAKPPLLDREYDHDKKFTPHWGGLSWLVQEGAPRLRKPTARMAAQEHHYRYGNLANMRTPFPGYLDFGVIAPPAAANGALRATGGDWCRRELALEADGKTAMTLIVSRLSPALLAESDSAEFMIFGRTIGSAQPFHCVSPRWMAYPSGGGTAVSELKEQPVVFDQPADWLLLWQGKTNAFGNATMNRDISYKYSEWLGWGGIHSPEWERHICYEADAPVLLVFGNPAVCAQKEADGGVVCGFERAAGALAVMPLFDFAYPRAEETDRWRQALPETVSRACRAWASRLLQFPLAVRESWKVDERADAVHIDDAFAFRPLRGAEEGVRFAPLPPMLAVAMGAGFPISLSGKPSDTGLMTYCGPYQGVEGASQYTLRIAGTKKYYRETRVIKPPSGGEMERRLGAELRGLVAPVIDEGPFAPWSPYLGIIAAWPADILWMNPESQISYPLSFLPVLEKDQQSRLAAYLRRVREELPPESVPAIPWKAGTRRERCRDSYEPDGILEYRLKNAHLEDGPARRGMIPFERAYTLENYYRLVGTPAERTAAWPAVRELLSPYLGYEDWATSWLFFHPKDGVPSEILFSPTYLDSFRGAGEVNGAIAGLIGLARWADLENDEEHGNLAKYLLAKRLALRFAMEKLTGAMVAAGLVNTAPYLGKMYDHLWYYQGRGPEDDPRVVASLDETTVVLSVFSAPHCARPGWVVSFDRMTPELARFLKDWLLPESARTVDYLEKVTPHWDAAYHRSSIGTTGDHNDLERPETGYSILPREELDSRRNPIRTGKPARLSSAAGRGLVLHGQTGGNYQGLPRLGLEGAGVEMRFQHVEEKRAAA